jgi:hypothetical protein
MMDPPQPPRVEQGDLYVGYLPVPARQKRFLRVAVPAALWLVAIASVVIAISQPDPGRGEWETGRARTFEGILVARPYPTLFADDRGDGRPGALLLAATGKHGVGDRAAGRDGQRVALSGWLLRRDGRRLLELEPRDDAIVVLDARPASTPPAPAPMGRVTLRGEIVDSKCYLGAMKPGSGRTHKECATLCVMGGIPPMLLTRDARGARVFYLLCDPSGGALEHAAFPFIADPVEVTGDLEEAGGMLRLKVRAVDIRRL